MYINVVGNGTRHTSTSVIHRRRFFPLMRLNLAWGAFTHTMMAQRNLSLRIRHTEGCKTCWEVVLMRGTYLIGEKMSNLIARERLFL